MNTPHVRVIRSLLFGVAVAFAALPVALQAQAKKKNPSSKLFVSDVSGEAQIVTDHDTVEDLARRSVYSAEGTVIETQRPQNEQDRAKSFSTMVYSNGTGAFFDADTRVEIRRFVQEPFLPTRTDMEVEPSISQTQAFIARGTVGLCASKLVAGSTMSYTTPHGSVNIRGRKIVIQAEAGMTRISMLEGESTVRAGTMDMGGHTIHSGEQAIIRPGAPGQPNSIEVVKIPPRESALLDDKVAMACMAKRTVYFEVRGRQSDSGEVDAFNTEAATERRAGDPIVNTDGEIIAVPVVPDRLPVQFTVSPATLLTPSENVVTPGRGTPTPGQGGPPGN